MKGYSLHIGLNKVSSIWKEYGERLRNPIPDLRACVNDAMAMEQIAKSLGYQTKTLFDSQATNLNVKNYIETIARTMDFDDIFLLTYSGHGSQVRDRDDKSSGLFLDEPDGFDETWVLYDHQMFDDELQRLWSLFPEDSRIVLLSDSCHSGTIARSFNSLDRLNPLPPFEIKASGIQISGCQDWQYSMDGVKHGTFTQALLEVWDNGRFVGNYPSFCDAIIARLPVSQQPNYFPFGRTNSEFEKQRPFSI